VSQTSMVSKALLTMGEGKSALARLWCLRGAASSTSQARRYRNWVAPGPPLKLGWRIPRSLPNRVEILSARLRWEHRRHRFDPFAS